ncbi:Zinc finger MYM-type protein 1 [Holothuria leucospilota]|uniref:Zinc finger MYM-type protein 1 n=1 Tax=Holothuria leucospilota TaxID=206669 RepID=A0A9Q0YR79_HOLLE|nr:Zinc finger MYM-type protein 1 [Holothuria leucospilota]
MVTQMVSTQTKRGFTVLKFQRQWFKKFRWLHCDTKSGKAFCHVCISGTTQGLVNLERNHETNFLNEGFCNWKKSMEKLKQHEASDLHKLCILKLHNAKQKTITTQLSDHASREQANARHSLIKLITSLRYLATEGAAIRGEENDDGMFRKLLELRSGDDEGLRRFMSRKTNFTSHEIQNEIFAIMSRQVLQKIICQINGESKIFATIVDGTTDISGNEQECVCIRFVDKDLEVHEEFIGLYNMKETTGKAIADMLKDVLIRTQLPIANLRAQTYDGASNMSGEFNGCQLK